MQYKIMFLMTYKTKRRNVHRFKVKVYAFKVVILIKIRNNTKLHAHLL